MGALLPSAEHVLDVGMRRAVDALRQGAPIERVETVLIVAGLAADLLQSDAPALPDDLVEPGS